ncbi:MAG: hypothetical protein HYZ23_10440 [Chloroflexi bacterium]|nr:hypothetical protein [Chloroflexota bacterium]
MKKRMQRGEAASLLFELTDKGVEFRNRWRGIALAAIWLVLSGLTMILAIIGVPERLHVAILIGMSFLKYIPLLAVVYGLSRKMAARYLDDVYELHDEDLASGFLEEVTFGYGYDKITIREGKIPEKDEVSPVILIGGPGLIQVNLDNVALLERVNGEPEVIHPRKQPWRLGRFERIREIGKHDEVGKREYAIINLRDQFISGLAIKARTKDGIPIEAQDVKVLFSLLRRRHAGEEEETQGDSYLFEEDAVTALVYNQAIITPPPAAKSGIGFPWDTTVIPLVVTEMEKLITSHTLSEILASISQREVDLIYNNDQTIAQMRVELTGQQTVVGGVRETSAPNFKPRSKITAQFFEDPFREKAATIGVSIEWIDIGTWQMPNNLTALDKHKEAWNLARENAKKLAEVERSKKAYETKEIIKLIENVVIRNYEKPAGRGSFASFTKEKDWEKEEDEFWAENPDLVKPTVERRRETGSKDAMPIAKEILKAFRKELLAGKTLIQNDSRPAYEKEEELVQIQKSLHDIDYIIMHWLKR